MSELDIKIKEKTKQENKKRYIKEIFSDYETRANIKNAEIKAMNLSKKKNVLDIIIESEEWIEVKEIWYFEKFLKERFFFNDINLIIKYTENVKLKNIKDEWRNIICYMAHKYPITKPMLLMKSDIEIEENIINVNMHIKGAEFLKAKKTDKELEKILKNLYGTEYKIELKEKISEKEVLKYKENARELEEKVIEEIVINHENQNKEENAPIPEEVPTFNDPDYVMPENLEGYVPEIEEEIPDLVEEQAEYIMGKPSKAKEKKVKIKDISANEGRVTIEGRILTCESRETKSGKGMLIFDIYDGTGTITCKSFAKDAKEGTDICEKIKEAKAIKAIGKAGLDTYAGDATVIANTIIKLENTDVPELPTEEEDTPLILGMTPVINDPLVKISELGVDDGKVSIEGEVIDMEDRELKSGKTLLSFDIYDGTSSMTCKAFLNKDNSKKVIKRMYERLFYINRTVGFFL